MVVTFNYSRRNCFLNRRKTLTALLVILQVNIKPHRILFEDVKNVNYSRQIEFTGVPLMILGSTMMNCTHGTTDHALSRKRQKLEQKKGMKVAY